MDMFCVVFPHSQLPMQAIVPKGNDHMFVLSERKTRVLPEPKLVSRPPWIKVQFGNMKILIATLSLCILFIASAVLAGEDTQLRTLQQRIDRIDSELRSAEAIRAIKRLQYAYGHYAELGLWHDLADLFADKGVGHYPAGDLGKEDIRKLFLQDVGKGKLGLGEGIFYPHIMLQPVITLEPDGKTARGRWRVLAMLGSYEGAASWVGGIYENEYILENGVWKINDLHFYPQYSGRYEQPGWTADKGTIPMHYNPARAGMPIPKNNTLPVSTKGPSNLAVLSKRLSALAHRAQLLNAEAELANLQSIYGYYVDRKMWDDVADLFADDATMELGLQGVYIGKASIRRALNQFGPKGLREGELNDRLQLQTIVHVAPDGSTAKARGTELSMTGVRGVGGEWEEGIFENTFIKRNGVWQFKSLHFYPRMRADYEKGWAKDAKPAPGPSKEFPPDRPPTATYEIFPKFSIVPFHFANPVTDAAPKYPTGTKADSPVRPNPGPGTLPAAKTIAELTKGIAEAERLLHGAVAYDASENIASAYGYYLDEFLWDETADLFTGTARRDFASISVETGRESIRQSLKSRYPGKKSAEYVLVHQLVQPVIHVARDGQSAKMRVRLFQLAGPSGGNGSWIVGLYECSTGIEDGAWKFTAMDLDYTWTADYKEGWAHQSDTYKGVVAAPFPKIVDPPFHYKNPVTGRKPPVLLPE